jgi:protein-S-isoprenylcysteine O-methyltransferase Ste14
MAQPSTNVGSSGPSSLAHLRAITTNVLIGTLFAFFAYAAFRDWRESGRIQMLILALQELLIVGLAITRRHSIEESRSVWDWAIAALGTAAPLLLRQEGLRIAQLEPIGIGLQLLGTTLATVAVWSLGRSFGIVAANRGVRTAGFYRFVRHPLYGSYLVGYVGFLLGNLSVMNVLMILAAFVCQYARAVAEERILLRDPEYQAYAQQVRYRFIPYLF